MPTFYSRVDLLGATKVKRPLRGAIPFTLALFRESVGFRVDAAPCFAVGDPRTSELRYTDMSINREIAYGRLSGSIQDFCCVSSLPTTGRIRAGPTECRFKGKFSVVWNFTLYHLAFYLLSVHIRFSRSLGISPVRSLGFNYSTLRCPACQGHWLW